MDRAHTYITGNLTRDPRERNVKNKQVAEFTVAVNDKYTDQAGQERTEVLYIECAAWGGWVAYILREATKGCRVFVDGPLKQSRWTDKEGKKRSEIYLKVAGFELIKRPVETETKQQEPQGKGLF